MNPAYSLMTIGLRKEGLSVGSKLRVQLNFLENILDSVFSEFLTSLPQTLILSFFLDED